MFKNNKVSRYLSACVWEKGQAKDNLDACALEIVQKGRDLRAFVLVIDGIASLDGGKETAGFLLKELTDWFYGDLLISSLSEKKLFSLGHQKLYELCYLLRKKGEEEQKSFGASLTFAVVLRDTAYLFSSGVTRAYLLSKERPRQLTKDQGDGKKQVSACIGSFGYTQAGFCKVKIKEGQALFLCTGGVYEKGDLSLLHPSGRNEEGQIGKHLKEFVRQTMGKGEKGNATALWLAPVSI